MKVFSIIFGIVLSSTSALGFDFSGETYEYKGEGIIFSENDDSWEYTVRSTIESISETEMQFTEVYSNEEVEIEYKYLIVPKENKKFFKVMVGDFKIGDGYCFRYKWKGKKVCHMEYTWKDGNKYEKTVEISFGGRISKRVGSTVKEGVKYIWNDKLRKDYGNSEIK
ncbi:MAG: hypothetical protein HRU09_17470 [Oligoflexales bacterium]|nr:hypothetical protein [Oligoflexales bacterium]